MIKELSSTTSRLALMAAVMVLGLANGLAAATARQTTITSRAEASEPAESGPRQKKIIVETIDSDSEEGKSTQRDLPWLGVATEEASETLAAQLGLERGAGLVVSCVGADTPAAKAGLKKNDVLVQFESQVLVHPAQLRKLVQMRKVGDNVKMTFYRSGKKEEVSATLGKAKGAMQRQFREFRIRGDGGDEMKSLHEALGKLGVDKEAIRFEVHQGVEHAREAIEEVLRQTTNARRTFGPAAKVLEELARNGVAVDKDATVTVKSSGASVKTMVKADETGTYVIVANPKKRLTAHDKKGKLVFDGEIETPEQQKKMPSEIREKIKPMLEQMGSDKSDISNPEEGGAVEENGSVEQNASSESLNKRNSS